MSKTKKIISDATSCVSWDYPSLGSDLLQVSLAGGISKPSSDLKSGLYIVATPIGNLGDITLRALVTLARVDLILCEDTRVSGVLLKKFGIETRMMSYHDHNADKRLPEIMDKLQAGEKIALISDAGMPLISDPGFPLVRACHGAGVGVYVLPGASALTTALAGAGLPTDRFTFAGFLPAKKTARRAVLEKLKVIPVTLVFYEAPQRLTDTLVDMADIFGLRHGVVAREMTKIFEEYRHAPLRELMKHYADHPAKGEIVILVEGAKDVPLDLEEIEKHLRKAFKMGISLRDAVAGICADTGARHADVYDLALKIKKDVS